MLKDILKQKGISSYKLAKDSGLPYTTVNEIVLGKKNIKECNAKTVLALANTLNINVQELFDQNKPTLSSSWLDNKDKRFIFPIIEENKKIDISNFHPLKQKNINLIFNIISNDSRINKAIIFGSSTNIRCNNKSDIDIYIKLNSDSINNKTKNEVSLNIQEAINYDADIVWDDKVNKESNLYKNINKGVTIYE